MVGWVDALLKGRHRTGLHQAHKRTQAPTGCRQMQASAAGDVCTAGHELRDTLPVAHPSCTARKYMYEYQFMSNLLQISTIISSVYEWTRATKHVAAGLPEVSRESPVRVRVLYLDDHLLPAQCARRVRLACDSAAVGLCGTWCYGAIRVHPAPGPAPATSTLQHEYRSYDKFRIKLQLSCECLDPDISTL